MPTYSQRFDTVRNWIAWTGADYSARAAESEGTPRQPPASAEPGAMSTSSILLTADRALHAGRWHTTTEARLRGATWGEIGCAVNEKRLVVSTPRWSALKNRRRARAV